MSSLDDQLSERRRRLEQSQQNLRQEQSQQNPPTQQQEVNVDDPMDVDSDIDMGDDHQNQNISLRNAIKQKQEKKAKFEQDLQRINDQIQKLKEEETRILNSLKSLEKEIASDKKKLKKPNEEQQKNNDVEMENQMRLDEELARTLQAQLEHEDEQGEYANNRANVRSNNNNNNANHGIQFRQFQIGDGSGGSGFSMRFQSFGGNMGENDNQDFESIMNRLRSRERQQAAPLTPDQFFSQANNDFFGRFANEMSMDDVFDRNNSIFDGPFGFGRINNLRMVYPDVNRMTYEQLQHLFPSVPRGAQEEDIQQLPVETYKTKNKGKGKEEKEEEIKRNEDNSENERCCICLDDFKDNEEIRRLPCLHIFHKEEIDKWLRTNHVCPICRAPIEGSQQE